MGITRSVALAALLVAIPLRAHAGDKAAWTAAKANVSKDTTVLVGLDLTQLTKSSLFTMAFPFLLSQQPEVKEGLELIKTTCKIDPLKVVTSVVAGTDDAQKHGAMFVALAGIDQPKIVSCLEAVAKVKGGKDAKVGVVTDGKIVELTVGDKKVYMTWIGTNVLALPLDVANKADLAAWTAKGLAKSKVAKGMGKVNTSNAIWAVSAVAKELDEKTKMKMGYGSVVMASSTISADLHVQLGTAAEAKAAAEKAQKELTTMSQSPGLAANLQKLLAGITVTSVADEIQVKGAMPESDVLSLIAALMQ
ncbi:MAG: hypothetical protein ABI175_30740 [Polyangiales bacterium]